MRLGILTGGGDVPGLNVCMKSVVTRAEENGWEVIGFRRGWAGPLNYNINLSEAENSDWIQHLTKGSVRTIDRTGGTFLHSSRTNPAKTRRDDIPKFLESTYSFAEDKKNRRLHPLRHQRPEQTQY
ncbi:hypothetical protein CCP2SC5_2080001 [Azospirillaceae bacterium]